MSKLIKTVRRGARADSYFTAYGERDEFLAIGPTAAAAVDGAVERGYDYSPTLTEVVDEPAPRPWKAGGDGRPVKF